MAVPSTIADLDTVAANNSPSGSESIGTNLDDYLRSHAAIIKQVSNAKVDSANPSFSGTLTHSGDVVLSGSGKRITGDFSNATLANRVMFQTSTVNGNTTVAAIPNGSSTTTAFWALNGSGATPSFAGLSCYSTEALIESGRIGAGTYLPMTFYTGGSESFRCATDGTLTVSKAAGLGYGAGAGGTVTQATSKSTAVTLNKPTGQITMNAAALAASTSVQFVLNNNLITSSADNVILTIAGGGSAGAYIASVYNVSGAGNCSINLRNMTAGSLSEAVILNFAIIKGSNA